MTHDELRSLYRAFNARDIDAILVFMHPDVDWPNGMEGGRVRGHQGIREYWTRQWEIINPYVEPLRIFDEDDGKVVVEVHQVVRDMDSNLVLDAVVQHVYAVSGGKIERMEIRGER